MPRDVDCRDGLKILIPQKSFSLSVTTKQPCVSDTAATIISKMLRGRPTALPSAIKRAQTSFVVKRQDATCKLCLRPFAARKPCFKSMPSFSVRQFENAALDLGYGH